MSGKRKAAIILIIIVALIAITLILYFGLADTQFSCEPEEIVPPPSVPQPEQSEVIPEQQAGDNTIIYTEAQLQNMFMQFAGQFAGSDKVSVDEITVKLDGDRMLVSGRGKALGLTASTEDMVVTVNGRTVTAEGVAKISKYTPAVKIIFDITTQEGKPVIEIKYLKVPPIIKLLVSISEEKIASMVNGTIESRGWTLPFDIESVRIEDSKMILTTKK